MDAWTIVQSVPVTVHAKHVISATLFKMLQLFVILSVIQTVWPVALSAPTALPAARVGSLKQLIIFVMIVNKDAIVV